MERVVTKRDVREFWEDHFLYSFETGDVSPEKMDREFFLLLDSIKSSDVEVFSSHFWEFEKAKGKKVLDVGCGNGWLVRNFAKNGADVTGVDLTRKGAFLTRRSLGVFGYQGRAFVADAEALPFKAGSFDVVSCSGVLHHTVSPEAGIDEIYRVLKPRGVAYVSLYYKNLLLRRLVFPLTMLVFNLLRVNPPGREEMKGSRSVEDFVRRYDGDRNPKGIAYDRTECARFFQRFRIMRRELHYFPSRFIHNGLLKRFHRLLDRHLGTMVFVKLEKPEDA